MNKIHESLSQFSPRREPKKDVRSKSRIIVPERSNDGTLVFDSAADKDEYMKMKSRLKAYKYHRKLQDSAVKLDKHNIQWHCSEFLPWGQQAESVMDTTNVGTDFISHNKAKENISIHLPNIHREKVRELSERRARRIKAVIQRAVESYDNALKTKEDKFNIRMEAFLEKMRIKEQAFRRPVSYTASAKLLSLCNAGGFALALKQRLRKLRKAKTRQSQSFARNAGSPFSSPNSSIVFNPSMSRSQALGFRVLSLCSSCSIDPSNSRLVNVLTFAAARLMHILDIIRTRRHGFIVWTCMRAWLKSGTVAIAMKRFYLKVRKIQIFWRRSISRVHSDVSKLLLKFAHLEWDVVKEIVHNAPPEKPRQLRSSKTQSNIVLSATEKIKLRLTHEEYKKRFCYNEYKYLRYSHLETMRRHHRAMRQYREDVKAWSEDMNALRTLGSNASPTSAGSGPSQQPTMPACPSCFPSDSDVLEIIHRCREDPLNWKKICPEGPPNSVGGKPSVFMTEIDNSKTGGVAPVAASLGSPEIDIRQGRRRISTTFESP